MIRRPTPPLGFDETMAPLEQVLVGGYVTIYSVPIPTTRPP